MIDIRKLKELVRLMVANDLTELDLRDSEEQVTLRRPGANMVAAPVMTMPGPVAAHAAAAPVEAAAAPADDTEGLTKITSPMVGTFYSAADPDSPPFVSVGASVGPDSVVAIVEAMKIFNEIKAECSGTVDRVCIDNGASVEFGQVLFLVRPS